MPTTSEIISSTTNATQTAVAATDAANNNSLGTEIKNALYNSASQIQALLDKALAKGGLITSEELNALDEQTRLAKQKLLQAESDQTARKVAIYVGCGILAIGILWFITKK